MAENRTNQTKSKIARAPEELYNPSPERDMPLLEGENQDLSEENLEELNKFAHRVTNAIAGSTPRPNTYVLPVEGNLDGQSDIDPNASQNSSLTPSAAANLYKTNGFTHGTFSDLMEGLVPGSILSADRGFMFLRKNDYSRSSEPIDFDDDRLSPGDLLPGIQPQGEDNTPGSGRDQYAIPGAPKAEEVPDDAPEVQKKISSVLKMNRFNPLPKTPFMQDNNHVDSVLATKQEKFGVYDRNAPDIKFSSLAEVAEELLIKQTGHGYDTGELGAILPSGPQALPEIIKVDATSLYAQNTPAGGEITKDRMSLHNDEDDFKSVGVLNSHLEPFQAGTPSRLAALGIAIPVAVGLFLILFIFSLLLELLSIAPDGSRKAAEDPYSVKSLVMGDHAPNLSKAQKFVFNIPEIDHGFDECFNRGLAAFFGVLENDEFNPLDLLAELLTGLVGTSVPALFANPGYYVAVLRRVIADATDVSDAITGLASGNPLTIILKIFDVFGTIVQSATYKFIIVMVGTGNQVLNELKGHARLASVNPDTLPAEAQYRQVKSRSKILPEGELVSDDTTLAWAHRTVPSRYVIPGSAIRAYHQGNAADSIVLHLGKSVSARMAAVGKDGLKGAPEDASKYGDMESFKSPKIPASTAHPGRIPAEIVYHIEEVLESEYMPFYFHDLRNNQIIAFHAFLDSFSDSFSPAWNETESYGRPEPVAIYKSTKRAISVNFTVVALDAEDFNVMYFNLNNLVSMVYPQYSKGKIMGKADAPTHIMPFSQLPTASPIIRMRVGDLFSSNYSESMGIGRDFGLGTAKTPADEGTMPVTADVLAAIKKHRDAVTDPGDENTMFGAPPPSTGYKDGNVIFLSSPRVMQLVTEDGKVGVISEGKSVGRGASKSTKPRPVLISSATPLEVKKVGRADKPLLEIFKSAGEGKSCFYFVQPKDPKIKKAFDLGDRGFIISHDMIGGSDIETFAELSGIKPSAPGEGIYPAAKLSAATNGIIRAFNTTKGRGMAGYITSLSMDWGDATWSVEPGKRAPKECKISIAFTPIHDTPLGVSYDGGLRGVAYNVGEPSRVYAGDPYDTAEAPKTKPKSPTPTKGNG